MLCTTQGETKGFGLFARLPVPDLAARGSCGRTVHVVHRRRNKLGFRPLLATISLTYELPDLRERKVVLFVENGEAHDAKPVASGVGMTTKSRSSVCRCIRSSSAGPCETDGLSRYSASPRKW